MLIVFVTLMGVLATRKIYQQQDWMIGVLICTMCEWKDGGDGGDDGECS